MANITTTQQSEKTPEQELADQEAAKKQLQRLADDLKKNLLSPVDRAKLLEYNSKIKDFNAKIEKTNATIEKVKSAKGIYDSMSPEERNTLKTNITNQISKNAEAAIQKEVDNAIKDVTDKVNNEIDKVNAVSSTANDAIDSISSMMHGGLPSGPFGISEIIKLPGFVKYASIGSAFGLTLEALPVIPVIPSLKSLMGMVKKPKLNGTSKTVGKGKEPIKKLGRMKKVGGGMGGLMAAVADVKNTIDKSANVTSIVPGLEGVTDKLKGVQTQLGSAEGSLTTFNNKITGIDDRLDNAKAIAKESDIKPETANTIAKYKKSIDDAAKVAASVTIPTP